MFKIVGTLPVKTRLPFAAWILRRTCNTVLVSSLADAGQQPNGTGSEASHGSLCLYDRSTQFIRGNLMP